MKVGMIDTMRGFFNVISRLFEFIRGQITKERWISMKVGECDWYYAKIILKVISRSSEVNLLKNIRFPWKLESVIDTMQEFF